jgi:hypothetical protein
MPECAENVPPQYRLETDHHAACFLHRGEPSNRLDAKNAE